MEKIEYPVEKVKLVPIYLSLVLVTGCATVTPAPDRIHWDNAPAFTQCTEDSSGIDAQYGGSLMAVGIGGWKIGTGLALGYVPIVGFSLAAVGLFGAVDSGTKFEQVKQCKEFKQYLLLRKEKDNSVNNNSTEAKLKELKALFLNNSITESEYKESRNKILDNIK